MKHNNTTIDEQWSSILAILSGSFASLNAICAKMTFIDQLQMSYRILFAIACVLSNVAMWWLQANSLRYSSTSLKPTLINTAVNLLLSGIAGVTLFAESHFWQWWIGIALILIGVSMTAAVHDEETENNKLK